MEKKIKHLSNVKSDIIQDLLEKCVELLSKEYKECFKISSDMCNDDEMYIFIDSIFDKDKIDMDNEIHKLYLDDVLNEFEWKCKEFILKLDKELPLKHLCFSETFHVHHKDFKSGDEFYRCELHFRIKGLDV